MFSILQEVGMNISKGRLAFSLILIGLGAWYMAINLSPQVSAFAYGHDTWPLQIIGLGAYLALIGLVCWSPGWFIPACIIAGTGGLLYYQNMSGDWSSWAYTWTLIPAFVATGLLLLGLFTWKRGPVIGAGWTMFASMVLFGIFGSTLGRLPVAGVMAPVAIILLGVMLLLTPILRRRKQ
jgi:hypothetical protein